MKTKKNQEKPRKAKIGKGKIRRKKTQKKTKKN